MLVLRIMDFFVLSLLALLVERCSVNLREICKWQQALQMFYCVYNIALHVIITPQEDLDAEYRSSRLASHASFIAFRLMLARLFQFKAEAPTQSYLNEMHEPTEGHSSYQDLPESPRL